MDASKSRTFSMQNKNSRCTTRRKTQRTLAAFRPNILWCSPSLYGVMGSYSRAGRESSAAAYCYDTWITAESDRLGSFASGDHDMTVAPLLEHYA